MTGGFAIRRYDEADLDAGITVFLLAILGIAAAGSTSPGSLPGHGSIARSSRRAA